MSAPLSRAKRALVAPISASSADSDMGMFPVLVAGRRLAVATFGGKRQAKIAHRAAARQIGLDELERPAASLRRQDDYESQRRDADQAVKAEHQGDAHGVDQYGKGQRNQHIDRPGGCRG